MGWENNVPAPAALLNRDVAEVLVLCRLAMRGDLIHVNPSVERETCYLVMPPGGHQAVARSLHECRRWAGHFVFTCANNGFHGVANSVHCNGSGSNPGDVIGEVVLFATPHVWCRSSDESASALILRMSLRARRSM